MYLLPMPLETVNYLTGLVSKNQRALTRIAELHKLQEITLPNGEFGLNCTECNSKVYPCNTVYICLEVAN